MSSHPKDLIMAWNDDFAEWEYLLVRKDDSEHHLDPIISTKFHIIARGDREWAERQIEHYNYIKMPERKGFEINGKYIPDWDMYINGEFPKTKHYSPDPEADPTHTTKEGE